MGFNTSSTQKSKNQFSARIVSNKTESMVCWAHLTDDMARRVFGVSNVTEITYAAAAEKLPLILDNERTSVRVTDMTAAIDVVDILEY